MAEASSGKGRRWRFWHPSTWGPSDDEVKDSKDVLLAVVAGLWAAVGISIPATDMTNARKDIIVSGKLDQQAITLAHRWSIYANDWWGAVIANAVVSFLFAYLLVIVCSELKYRFRIFSYVCAIASAAYGVSWLYTGSLDATEIRSVLCSEPIESPADAAADAANCHTP